MLTTEVGRTTGAVPITALTTRDKDGLEMTHHRRQRGETDLLQVCGGELYDQVQYVEVAVPLVQNVPSNLLHTAFTQLSENQVPQQTGGERGKNAGDIATTKNPAEAAMDPRCDKKKVMATVDSVMSDVDPGD